MADAARATPVPASADSVERPRASGRGLLAMGLLGVALVAVGPWVFDTYLLNILIKAFFFAIVAVTVDVLWGYTGYLTFGQSAFFGIGAYAAGLVFTHGGSRRGTCSSLSGSRSPPPQRSPPSSAGCPSTAARLRSLRR